jgi:hypothetical protein
MTETPQARREDYWRTVGDGGDRSLIDVLDESAGAEWDLRAATVTGAESGLLFVLVVRERDGDAVDRVRRIGYASVDMSGGDDPVRWSDNYVDVRVQGSIDKALLRTFAAIDGGGATPDDPMLLDARSDRLDDDPDALLGSVEDASEDVSLTCDRCDTERPSEELQTLRLGGIERTVCKAGCGRDD